MKVSETGQPDNDIVLDKIEKKIKKEYTQAEKDMEKKLNKYLKKFEAQDKKNKKLVKSGAMSEDDYWKWRENKIVKGNQWQDMCDNLAKDLDNSRLIAQKIVSGDLPSVYANGVNYGTWEIESTGLNTNFTLYNHDAVEVLVSQNPKLYPDPTVGSETWQKLKSKEVQKWSKAKINSAITQGILQGEAINAVAKRLRKVTDMDYKASIRNARTMVGAAQNAGHQRSYERAEAKGVQLVKVWNSTLDMRTRHTHAVIDGETVAVKEKFSNGLLYPKDPSGAPAEIYNCRCRESAWVKGFSKNISDFVTGPQDSLNGMTYDEWKQYHKDVLDGKFKKPKKGSPYELVNGKKWYEISDEMDGKPYWSDFNHELILTGDKKGYDLASDYWTALLDGTEKNKKVEEILQEHYGKKTAEKVEDVFSYEKYQSKGFFDIYEELEDKDPKLAFEFYDAVKKSTTTTKSAYWSDVKNGLVKDKKIEDILKKANKADTAQSNVAEVLANTKTIKPTKKALADFDADEWLESLKANEIHEFEEQTRKMQSVWNFSEEDALTTYTGSSYNRINSFLRGLDNYPSETTTENVENITKALAKSKTEEDIILRRGSGYRSLKGLFGEDFADALEEAGLDEIESLSQKFSGAIGQDKAFMSTTPSPHGGFDSDINYIIRAPKGTEGAYIAPISNFKGEQEFLLQRGTKFVVREIKTGTGGADYDIYLDIIGQEY